MEMEINPLQIDWKYPVFTFDRNSNPIKSYEFFNDEQLAGLIYLKRTLNFIRENGFTLLVHFDGRLRSGKSLSAVTIAALFDKTFLKNFEQRVVHYPTEFLKEVENIAKQGIRGAVIVIDEAGQSMAASSWFEQMSKAISQTAQVFGYLHIMVFFVSPVKDFLLSGLRKMTNLYIHVKRYNKIESVLFLYDVSYSSMRQKTYYKHPSISMFGEKHTIPCIRLRHIPKEIIKQYQELELKRKPDILLNLKQSGLESEANAKPKVKKTIEELVKEVSQNLPKYENEKSTPERLKISFEAIAEDLGIPQQRAKIVKRQIEMEFKMKKGIKKEVS